MVYLYTSFVAPLAIAANHGAKKILTLDKGFVDAGKLLKLPVTCGISLLNQGRSARFAEHYNPVRSCSHRLKAAREKPRFAQAPLAEKFGFNDRHTPGAKALVQVN
jgi:hypothetical protein